MIYTYIRDVLFSNPARTRAILTEEVLGFPQSFHPSSGITPRFWRHHFLPNPSNFCPDAIYRVNYWTRGKTIHTLIKEFLLADSATWVRSELHCSLTVRSASEGFLRVNRNCLIGRDAMQSSSPTFRRNIPTPSSWSKIFCAAFSLFVVGFGLLFYLKIEALPITVAARSEKWTVFTRSNTGIVDSNPTQGMEVGVYSVFVLSCV
jgi:hypothetical protein